MKKKDTCLIFPVSPPIFAHMLYLLKNKTLSYVPTYEGYRLWYRVIYKFHSSCRKSKSNWTGWVAQLVHKIYVDIEYL